MVDFPLKLYRVVAFKAPGQLRLKLIRKIRRSQQPLVRADNFFIIRLFYFCTNPCLAQELYVRDKEVQQGAQRTVNRGKGVPRRGGGKAAVADEVPDAGEVFLLDEAVVVFAVGA
jgi:hypothetical protein